MRPATCNSSRTATSPPEGKGAVAWCGQGGRCNASLSGEAKQSCRCEAKRQLSLNELTSSRCSGSYGWGWSRVSGRARQRVSEQDTTHVDDLCAAPDNAPGPNG